MNVSNWVVDEYAPENTSVEIYDPPTAVYQSTPQSINFETDDRTSILNVVNALAVHARPVVNATLKVPVVVVTSFNDFVPVEAKSVEFVSVGEALTPDHVTEPSISDCAGKRKFCGISLY